MGGLSRKTKYGLISLLVLRRQAAEKKRRELLAEASTAKEVKAAQAAKARSKKSGWFR